MNTNDRQHRPSLIRPDYYAQLWFEDGQLTAAVLQDDYTAWFDLTAGIEGSTLADANVKTSKEELETLLNDWYLTAETAIIYYDVIETNEPEVAERLYPEFLERGFRFIGILHQTTLQKIRERAQLLYIRENGDAGA